ncbi:MAG: hypothetical protein LC685_01355 [Actinobacteria bacterium]|nr:hypothetical protein [Actinomycetota bacterium]
MLSYDVHQHLWPEALIEGLRSRRERPRLRAGVLELPSGDWEADLGAHTLEARLALLDRDELDVAVISCPPTLELDAELAEAYHEGIAEVVAASNGRLVALASGSARDGFAGACVSAWSLAGLAELEPLLAELDRRRSLCTWTQPRTGSARSSSRSRPTASPSSSTAATPR